MLLVNSCLACWYAFCLPDGQGVGEIYTIIAIIIIILKIAIGVLLLF